MTCSVTMVRNWKNSFIDNLPYEKGEVLISVDGINYIATYNKSDKGFHIRDTEKFIRIDPANSTIYWTEISGRDK